MLKVIEGQKLEKSTIGVILDRDLRERLEAVAAENERSVGAEVRIALRSHLDRMDEGDEAA